MISDERARHINPSFQHSVISYSVEKKLYLMSGWHLSKYLFLFNIGRLTKGCVVISGTNTCYIFNIGRLTKGYTRTSDTNSCYISNVGGRQEGFQALLQHQIVVRFILKHKSLFSFIETSAKRYENWSQQWKCWWIRV